MRIRSIKPEFWRSQDMANRSFFTRLLFVGLWSYVDDNGVGMDSVPLIRADLFPLDDDVQTISKLIAGALTELSVSGQVTRYEGSDGRHYLFIDGFSTHQKINRPTKSRKPMPTSGKIKDPGEVTEPSVSAHVILTEDSLGEGIKGAREQGNEVVKTPSPQAAKPADPDGFDEFWQTYPRRQGRGDAVKAFAKAIKRADIDEILAAAHRHAVDPNRVDQFTAMAATWLNQDRWLDDALPDRARERSGSMTASEKVSGWGEIAQMAADPNKTQIGA